MKKLAFIVVCISVAANGFAQTSGGRTRAVARPGVTQSLQQAIRATYGTEAETTKAFIGSEICLACHTQHAGWRSSLHSTMHASLQDDAGAMNPAIGVIFDGNNNGVDDFKDGLDFNKISSGFDVYKPNAPILSFAAGEPYPYRVTIGTITYKAFMKEGGFFQQRLITRVPVTDGAPDGLSRSWYMLPFAYSPRNHTYATYNPDKWWSSAGSPTIAAGMTAAQVAGIGRSWTKACIGCHVTGYSIQKAANAEWVADPPPAVLYSPTDRNYVDLDFDGNLEFTGVGCESCHGAGSQHVLSAGDRSKIVNPKNLTAQQQVWLCAQCHTRGKSVPSGTHDFAYKENEGKGYQIGDNVWDYYHDEAGRWPDGKTPTKGEQQFQAHEVSVHFTNPYHTVLCSNCHDPHSGERYLVRKSVATNGVQIATRFDDNTLCLSCHASYGPFKDLAQTDIADAAGKRELIGRVVTSHTHHSYAPERMMGLSRCTTCHMPRTAKRDYEYDETSHTMEAISPEKTMLHQDKGGMPSSCAGSCHSVRVNDFNLGMDPTFKKWDETFDRANATFLLKYFGPGGIWWDTKAAPSASAESAGRED